MVLSSKINYRVNNGGMSYLLNAELNGGFNGNYGGGNIGEKSRTLGESFNYGRSNGMRLKSTREGRVVHMSCSSWEMLSGGKHRFGYMSNTGIASSFEI
ncbi:hypothetical protein F2Q69_00060902 [Brassica cretica]|uniref:Uncharacterized protein n=1 Tax=Brassica cretica TaxID=69181 RepID=A0A8S9RMA7_BRACR|nr:hypothetical protein F2Q69_00060902 [Brassica cretica]